MSELVHPGGWGDHGDPPPAVDPDRFEYEDTGRFLPSTFDDCDGPGALVREYRYSPHTTCLETIEQCPACDGTLPHLNTRVIRLEDQGDAEQNRLPGAPAREAS